MILQKLTDNKRQELSFNSEILTTALQLELFDILEQIVESWQLKGHVKKKMLFHKSNKLIFITDISSMHSTCSFMRPKTI